MCVHTFNDEQPLCTGRASFFFFGCVGSLVAERGIFIAALGLLSSCGVWAPGHMGSIVCGTWAL